MARETASIVNELLRQFPKTRDNDFLLVLRTWILELGPSATEEMKQCFRTLLNAYEHKAISNFESVRRSRQKLQEENPELRGQKYHARQEQAELFRKEIKR